MNISRIWQYDRFTALLHNRHMVSGRVVRAPLANLGEFQNARQRDQIALDGRVRYAIRDPAVDDLTNDGAVDLELSQRHRVALRGLWPHIARDIGAPSFQSLSEGLAVVAELGDGYLPISLSFAPCKRNNRIVRA